MSTSTTTGKIKIVVAIILVSAGIFMYGINYSETHEFLRTIVGSTQVRFRGRVEIINETTNTTTNIPVTTTSTTTNIPILPKKPKELTQPEMNDIIEQINIINREQKIYNSDKYGPITTDTFVAVVQVHFRYEYLNTLIQSLAICPEINNSLIIFSHDIFSPELNTIIQDIKFARVMQIFVPITKQLNPGELKGKGAGLGEMKSQTSSESNTKQHWWWKANFVFGKVKVLGEYDGVIYLLEEDDYVTPDYIFVMRRLETIMRDDFCFGCNTLIGGHKFYGVDVNTTWTKNNGTTHNKAIITDLVGQTVNRGIAFNRTTWKHIKDCEKSYCQSAEKNWDYTIMYMSASHCIKPNLRVITPEAPRLIHIGGCGIHEKENECNPLPEVQMIKEYEKIYHQDLFPNAIYLSLEFLYTKAKVISPWTKSTKLDEKICFILGEDDEEDIVEDVVYSA